MSELGALFWVTWRGRALLGESPPTREEVVDAIRRHGVPPDMGPQVADWLTEKSSRRGRPRLTSNERAGRWMRDYHLALLVRVLQAHYRLQGLSRPRVRALEVVAARKGMDPDTLRKTLMTLKRVGPEFYRLPPVEDAEAMLISTGITDSQLEQLLAQELKHSEDMNHWEVKGGALAEETRGEEKGPE